MNCPGGICPWGEAVRGELSGGEVSGGNLPRTDDPLVVLAKRFLLVGLTEDLPRQVFVEVAMNYPNILLFEFIQLVSKLVGERLGLEDFKAVHRVQDAEQVVVGLCG